jgi:Putative restriction endonuclease
LFCFFRQDLQDGQDFFGGKPPFIFFLTGLTGFTGFYEIYQETGVREYWIVNPHERTVQVFQLNEQGKYIVQPFVEDDILTTPILPDLKISLMEVFED